MSQLRVLSKEIFLILLLIFLSSCASSDQVLRQSHPRKSEKVTPGSVLSRSGGPEDDSLNSSEKAVAVGLIFSKTIFEGIVETSYVEFVIVDQTDPLKEYHLIIGDKEGQKNFPWDVQTVRPGYFFIELPEGQYRIKSIAIPVGTTKARESTDIVFDVKNDTATYLGDIKITGIKEKVKVGGLPMIQPGFEYIIDVSNDEQEAYRQFYSHLPDFKGDVITHLMQVNLATNSVPGPS